MAGAGLGVSDVAQDARRSGGRRRHALVAPLIALIGAMVLLAATSATSQPLEPPPEATEGADYVADPADSMAEGQVELGVGAVGKAGGRVERRRRVRFAGGDMRGTVREGTADPLSGGAIEGRGLGGDFSAGRLAPRWGRGLVLGSSAEPWRDTAVDRGRGAAFRGRAGEGVAFRRGEDDFVEAMCGRFARRELAGLRVRARGAALGALTDRHGALQSTLALGEDAVGAELAFDGRGRWRAEGAIERPVGAWAAAARARAGVTAFRSLAEPLRAGPSRAVSAALAGPLPAGTLRATLATWRFRPGVAGARAAFEVLGHDPRGGRIVLGFEEQHGARRDVVARGPDLRQGAWGEWRSPPAPLTLALRHEAWGSRAPVRDGLRVVSAARVDAAGPLGTGLKVTHTTFHARRGESVYLPEAESDRLVLRALSGDGERTRVELSAPCAGGRAHLALDLATGSRAATRWSVDWTRRARTGG